MVSAIEQAEHVIDYAVRALETYRESDLGTRRRVVELLGSNFCLTDGILLWKPNSYLRALLGNVSEKKTVEPTVIGSESTKKTDDLTSVYVGRGTWTRIKLLDACSRLCQAIVESGVPFPSLPVIQ